MFKGRAYTLVAYTFGGQKSKGRTYTLVAYTSGGQMSKGCAYTLVAYTCGGQMYKGHPTRCLHTPAVGKCVRDEPTYSPGGLEPPSEAFGPLLIPLVESNCPENSKNAHFLTFRA